MIPSFGDATAAARRIRADAYLGGAAGNDEFDEDARLLAAFVLAGQDTERLRAALEAVDDLLRRLSEWDMLASYDGKPVTGDGPYWQAEIARGREKAHDALASEGGV